MSIALKVEYGQFSYFIGGDLTGGGNGTTDMETLIAPFVGDLDVLKLSHHGSATSSNAGFLTAVRPETLIISVGNGGVNRTYGLPKQVVMDRLMALPRVPRIYLTNVGEGGSARGQKVVDDHVEVRATETYYSVNGEIFEVDERAGTN